MDDLTDITKLEAAQMLMDSYLQIPLTQMLSEEYPVQVQKAIADYMRLGFYIGVKLPLHRQIEILEAISAMGFGHGG